jgi:trigger factor
MKVAVENVDRVRKSVQVILEEDKIAELREEIYDDLKKKAKIKGFRPGKVPRNVIQAMYKDYIEDELKRKMVEETMGEALMETKVEPVSEPRIEFLDDSEHGYKMECEIMPEFELPSYKGIEVEAAKATVPEEEIGKRLDAMREMHADLVDREAGEAAQKGDLAVIQYEGFRDGKPVKGVKADAYPLDLGNPGLMPEFETALIGARVGDEKEINVDFGADYPDKDIAGKSVLFKLVVKEIKARKFPELNEDFAKDAGFENMEKLQEQIRKDLEKQAEAQRKNVITEQISQSLIERSDIPVPARLLEKRADMMVQDARTRMKASGFDDQQDQSLNATLRKEYEPEAEKRIRLGAILEKIAEQEGIEVRDSEVDDRLKQIAEETKRAYDYINDFYEKYNLKENLKAGMREEKTIDFLIANATIKEKE